MDPNQSIVLDEEEDEFVPSTQAPPVVDSAKDSPKCFIEFSESSKVSPSSPASDESIISETDSESISTDDQKREILANLCSAIMKLPDSIESVADFNKLDIVFLKTQAEKLMELEDHPEFSSTESFISTCVNNLRKRVMVDLLESQPSLSTLNIGEEVSMGSENTEQQNTDMN